MPKNFKDNEIFCRNINRAIRNKDSLKALTKVDREKRFVKLDIDRLKELQERKLKKK